MFVLRYFISVLLITCSETFTSFVQLKHLLLTESLLVEILETFVPTEIQEQDTIKTFVLDYKERNIGQVSDEEFLSCPTNAYRLIKKLTHDFRKIEGALDHTIDNNEVWRDVRKSLPLYKDIDGAAMALIRIQVTYKIDATDMAAGLKSDVCKDWPLTADDCFEIGQAAYRAHDFKSALDWFDVTLDIDHSNLPAQEMKRLYDKENNDEEDSSDEGDEGDEGEDVYAALCRGDNIKTPANLVCRYKHTTPFFHLRPLKEEILSYDPYVATFHDIAAEGEIEKLKETATKYLTRSDQISIYSTKKKDHRVSSSAWLSDVDEPELESLSQRISAAIGLSLDTAGALQVVNYGIGGQYEPHYDYIPPKDVKKYQNSGTAFKWGNIALTAMVYLTDVLAGGATVFPKLGIQVLPQKGSMLVWYDMLEDGSVDRRTLHAGCPVLAGNKWVCNKWFHESGQVFHRPCGLKPNHDGYDKEEIDNEDEVDNENEDNKEEADENNALPIARMHVNDLAASFQEFRSRPSHSEAGL